MSTTANYKATVISVFAEIKEKSNGGQVQLAQCKVLDGPLAGLTVLSQRTILNAEGVAKSPVNVNDEVTLYHTQLESTSKPGTMQNFFEISTGLGASQDDINARLAAAMGVNTANALAEQAV